MNLDTPLVEVAGHLPVPAATILDEMPQRIQSYVLIQMRRVIVWWEEQGYVLDPVSYEAVLTALVASIAPLMEEIDPLVQEVERLKRRLAASDERIRIMTDEARRSR